MSKNSNQLSPQQQAIKNRKAYDDYVSHLKATGKKFPINQWGDVNTQGVAKACGFDRQVFGGKIMGQKFKADVKEIGTELIQARDKSKKAKEAKDSEKDLNEERMLNALNEQKIAALERKIMQLQSEIRRLKQESTERSETLSNMLATGRRFTL